MSVNPLAFTERTALAWNRSGLALAVVGAVALRSGQRTGLPAVGEALAGVSFAAAAAVWLYGASLYRHRRRTGDAAAAGRERALGILTGVTLLAALGSLALAAIG